MLHSVTLWRSQLQGWTLDTSSSGLYLQHWRPCFARIPIVEMEPDPKASLTGWGFSIRLDVIIEAVSSHRCPPVPTTTPQLVDGRG